MMKYHFALEYNESVDSDDRTGEFEWIHGESIIEASSLEDAIHLFFEINRVDLNEILDWESDEEGTNAIVSYGNSVDGGTLTFRVS